MKKKWICLAAVLLVLAAGGKIAFDKGRDFVTQKMVKTLAETEEVKKYKAEAEKALKAEQSETTEAEPTSSPTPEKTEEKKAETASGAKDFWSEPLVKAVYGRFSASEISTCSSMLSGGLTKEEKRYIKNLVYSRVSSAEISEIERLYYKYN